MQYSYFNSAPGDLSSLRPYASGWGFLVCGFRAWLWVLFLRGIVMGFWRKAMEGKGQLGNCGHMGGVVCNFMRVIGLTSLADKFIY